MILPADIREWRNLNVLDSGNHKIGVLESIYVDTTTDEPAMATIRTGLPTRHRLTFVPLDDVTLGPDYVKVPYAKALVKKAPTVGMDDILPAEAEKAIFQHYEMSYQTGAGGERQLARR
ncbi:PRC-barrel domain protein [Streptomyces sp. Amel2xB2]|uniref:PRC-barrel domain-containing protein n=1 Tax=Streptomyces sp. Amel2xB2 TaxID=1305829 RepID=UPI000DB94CF7|nr:PRC-barrel domain-containing protein [Streptomyces sp. Amel2xB2]RAJ58829.1 PRC-barrel domain protein [Streptomyces sp. Amel2xB2]